MALAMASLYVVPGTARAGSAASPVRSPASGRIRGTVDAEGGYAWLGIPYARPPLGPLRWRAPRPIEPWRGTRDALAPGQPCMQPGLGAAHSTIVGSEDCLYLNIWSPARTAPNAGKPVMVWIHGGGYTRGHGDTFDGAILAARQNVVVVTINYRLGIFGWFRHAGLRADSATAADRSGNYGNLDAIEALRWVRANIGAFGGDPGNVTIFGESAGGFLVASLLSAPPARGLFDKAIIQSGGTTTVDPGDAENYVDDDRPGLPKSAGELLLQLLIDDGTARDRADAKAHAAGLSPAAIGAYLRAKSFAQFEDAYAGLSRQDAHHPSLLPVLFRDGHVVPTDGIQAALEAGRYNHVPVIVGSTRDEFSILMASKDPDHRFVLQSENGGHIVPDRARFQKGVDYVTRLWRSEGVDDVANALARHQPNRVFSYRFDWDELAPAPWLDDIRLGATHGLDVPFVFGHLRPGPEYIQIPLITAGSLGSYRSLSARMMNYWGNFARTGKPGGGADLPLWSAWDANPGGIRKAMLLRSDGGPVMAAIAETEGLVFDALERDAAFPTEAERCRFMRDVYMIRAAMSFGVDGYRRFRSGACARADPLPWQSASTHGEKR